MEDTPDEENKRRVRRRGERRKVGRDRKREGVIPKQWQESQHASKCTNNVEMSESADFGSRRALLSFQGLSDLTRFPSVRSGRKGHRPKFQKPTLSPKEGKEKKAERASEKNVTKKEMKRAVEEI